MATQDYQSESAILGRKARAIINNGKIDVMQLGPTSIDSATVDEMTKVFKKQHTDVKSTDALMDSNTLRGVQNQMYPDCPKGRESITVVTSDAASFSELMQQTARLSKTVQGFYFQSGATSRSGGYTMVSQDVKDIFLRQYNAAENDDERKMLLQNNRNRHHLPAYQNWKTQLVAALGRLPPGVNFIRGGTGPQIDPNTQLFTFPLMVAYLRHKYTNKVLRELMIYLNMTGETKRSLAGASIEEFSWRVQNPNPLLIPLCGLTNAKIAGSVNLAVGGPCFTLAGLAFAAPKQETRVLHVMHELIGLCSKPITASNAGFYQTVASTVYRYLEPRVYHMNEHRIRGVEYLVNSAAMWCYNIDERTLYKKKDDDEGAKGKEDKESFLDSDRKTEVTGSVA